MSEGNIEKVFTVYKAIASRDPEFALRHLSPDRYVEHNPHAADGIEGFRDYVKHLPQDAHLKPIRSIEDEPYVITQADGRIGDQNTFFDVFRFDGDRIVEHWSFSAPGGPPNKSGHTQVDGPIEPRDLASTEKNKAFIRAYYETFHIAGDHSNPERYFKQDLCIRHEPGVHDGVAEFLQDVSVLMQHRTIDEIGLLIGQGDLVFLVAKGTHQSEPCLYVDLYRVEDEKLVEHWGFPQMVPPASQRKNSNGLI